MLLGMWAQILITYAHVSLSFLLDFFFHLINKFIKIIFT